MVEQASSSQSKYQVENGASLDFIVCCCFLIIPEERDDAFNTLFFFLNENPSDTNDLF